MTMRQRLFVAAYLDPKSPSWLNATRAAQRARYRWPDKQGPRLMQHVEVRGAIEARFTRELEAIGARA